MSLATRNAIPKYGRAPRGIAAPTLSQAVIPWLLSLILILTLTLVEARFFPTGRRPFNASPVWGRQPLLEYFVFTPSLVELLREGAGLNQAEFEILQQVTQEEAKQLGSLELESLEVIQNPVLTLEEKIGGIETLGYNQRVDAIVAASSARLERELGKAAYQRLSEWVESRWVVERALHGSPPQDWGLAPPGATRTYRVFATRYDSGGAYTVALPDQCLKFANNGYHLCDDDGYQVGQGYSVFISYEKSTAATVLEAGPWNVDDNYWATRNDPQPRRMFADLGLGIPEAQAAYFDGYNGGKDQYGRKVTAPFGIDLARQVSIDIGLEPGNNDWIDVSFLWTEGWGKKSARASQPPGGTPGPATTQEVIIQIIAATPGPDGAIIHVVQPGHTLIGIANVYQIELSVLLSQNGLSMNSVIHPGDRLVIKPAQASSTPTSVATATPTRTPTPRATRTPRPTQTTTPTETTSPGVGLNDPAENPAQSSESFAWDPLLLFIVILLTAGALLLLAGAVLSRRK